MTSTSYTYVESPNSNLVCCICRMAFVEPMTTRTCAHTFCRECISRAVEHVPQCPVDRSLLQLDDLMPADPIVRSLVDELVVECVHLSAGCTFTCQRQLLAAHLKDACQYTQVSCLEGECGQVVLRKDANSHSHKCVHRLQECDGCAVKVKAADLEAHHAVCPAKTASCSTCSSVFPRPSLTAHTAICPDLIVPCPHHTNGCPWTGPRHTLPSTHTPSCPYESIKEFFTVNNARLSTLTETNDILKAKVDALEGLVQSMRREMQAVKTALGPWYRPDGTYPTLPSPGDPPAETPSSSSRRYSLLSDTLMLPPLFHDRFSTPPSAADTDMLALYFPPESGEPQRPEQAHQQLELAQPPPRPTHRSSSSVYHFSDLGLLYPHHPQHTLTHNNTAYSHITPQYQQFQASVAPINLSTTLEGSLGSLRESIVTLSASVESLARQHDISLTNETMKLNEEVISLRANVHGLRMQVHTIMRDRNAQVTGQASPSSGWTNEPRGNVIGPSAVSATMRFPFQAALAPATPGSFTKL